MCAIYLNVVFKKNQLKYLILFVKVAGLLAFVDVYFSGTLLVLNIFLRIWLLFTIILKYYIGTYFSQTVSFSWEEVGTFFTILKLCYNVADTADNVKLLNVNLMDISNHSGDVLLKWEEPVTPNGLIVSYQIEYRRIDIENVRYRLTKNSFEKFYLPFNLFKM